MGAANSLFRKWLALYKETEPTHFVEPGVCLSQASDRQILKLPKWKFK